MAKCITIFPFLKVIIKWEIAGKSAMTRARVNLILDIKSWVKPFGISEDGRDQAEIFTIVNEVEDGASVRCRWDARSDCEAVWLELAL